MPFDLDQEAAAQKQPHPIDRQALLREIERDRMIARNERDDARDQYLADHGLSRSYSAEDMADYHHDMGGE